MSQNFCDMKSVSGHPGVSRRVPGIVAAGAAGFGRRSLVPARSAAPLPKPDRRAAPQGVRMSHPGIPLVEALADFICAQSADEDTPPYYAALRALLPDMSLEDAVRARLRISSSEREGRAMAMFGGT